MADFTVTAEVVCWSRHHQLLFSCRNHNAKCPQLFSSSWFCHRRSRYTWRAGWFQFSSPFFWGRHHNGSRTCPRFRPSWCVSPIRNKLREKTDIRTQERDFATPSSFGASTRHSSTCPPSSPTPNPIPVNPGPTAGPVPRGTRWTQPGRASPRQTAQICVPEDRRRYADRGHGTEQASRGKLEQINQKKGQMQADRRLGLILNNTHHVNTT